jgi:hypothetical protein
MKVAIPAAAGAVLAALTSVLVSSTARLPARRVVVLAVSGRVPA